MINKLLDMQKKLDEKVVQSRTVGANDLIFAMMDELLELQKELPETFKTWKHHEYSEEKMKMEMVDILFFYLKLMNLFEIDGEEIEQLYVKKWEQNMNRIGDGKWR